MHLFDNPTLQPQDGRDTVKGHPLIPHLVLYTPSRGLADVCPFYHVESVPPTLIEEEPQAGHLNASAVGSVRLRIEKGAALA